MASGVNIFPNRLTYSSCFSRILWYQLGELLEVHTGAVPSGSLTDSVKMPSPLDSASNSNQIFGWIDFDWQFICFFLIIQFRITNINRPVTQQQQQQPNHPGTAISTTENGRIILPKLNLNNNINQKNYTPSNISSNWMYWQIKSC
jgi:hypothetical protein